MRLRDGWRVLQEVICSPEDILGPLADSGGQHSVVPLARTVAALFTHATPHAPPKDIQTSPYHTYEQTHDDCVGGEYYANEVHDTSLEVNYYQRQLRRYSEERFISNFNFSDNNQHYTIDESEEYLNTENNNTDSDNAHYSPVYGSNELRNRGPYYQTNRVQFVMPFCKEDHILKSDNFEIYDTDEVDFPIEVSREEVDPERYDRGKMNLDIQNNLNSVISTETDVPKEVENRVLFTCLCLGTFFVSTILLIMYPL